MSVPAGTVPRFQFFVARYSEVDIYR